MDYIKIIHAFCDDIVDSEDAIMIRELPNDSDKDITLLIVSEAKDTARLIGRKGSVASALREIISIAGKLDNKRVHLKFESFEDEEREDKD